MAEKIPEQKIQRILNDLDYNIRSWGYGNVIRKDVLENTLVSGAALKEMRDLRKEFMAEAKKQTAALERIAAALDSMKTPRAKKPLSVTPKAGGQ